MAVVEEPRTIPHQVVAPPWTAVLHDWVTTVDHKKIGIMYVVMALVFLLVGGVEAMLVRSKFRALAAGREIRARDRRA